MPAARPPKKSESLEIRIPHPTKQAFMARCEAEGRTASEALRGFIEQHLSDPPRSRPRRPPLRLIVGVAAAAALGAVALPSIARPSVEGRFERMDANHDGMVSLFEYAARR